MTLPLTLTENWQSFSDKVINPHAPQIQRNEMKRAFHAGFVRAWELFTDTFAEMSDEDAVQCMNKLESEIITYMEGLMRESGFDPAQANLFQTSTENPQ